MGKILKHVYKRFQGMTPFKLSACSPFILINDNTEKLCLKFFFKLFFEQATFLIYFLQFYTCTEGQKSS